MGGPGAHRWIRFASAKRRRTIRRCASVACVILRVPRCSTHFDGRMPTGTRIHLAFQAKQPGSPALACGYDLRVHRHKNPANLGQARINLSLGYLPPAGCLRCKLGRLNRRAVEVELLSGRLRPIFATTPKKALDVTAEYGRVSTRPPRPAPRASTLPMRPRSASKNPSATTACPKASGAPNRRSMQPIPSPNILQYTYPGW